MELLGELMPSAHRGGDRRDGQAPRLLVDGCHRPYNDWFTVNDVLYKVLYVAALVGWSLGATLTLWPAVAFGWSRIPAHSLSSDTRYARVSPFPVPTRRPLGLQGSKIGY